MGLFDMADSFIRNVFCDTVKPKVGSVVKTRLVGGFFDHTGIYIGKDKIVELSGNGDIRIVSHKKFIDGDNGSLARVGVYMYVACAQDENGNCYALAAPDIARRARNSVGETRDYNLVFENCHMFTEYCINGKRDGGGILVSVELAFKEKFNLTPSNPKTLLSMWRSTGITS